MKEQSIRQTLEVDARRHPVLRKARRVIIALVGGTILLLGLALVVLPGPAVVVIPTGLAILALEFEWSRRWLRKAQAMLHK